jgi:hypothetical protein
MKEEIQNDKLEIPKVQLVCMFRPISVYVQAKGW